MDALYRHSDRCQPDKLVHRESSVHYHDSILSENASPHNMMCQWCRSFVMSLSPQALTQLGMLFGSSIITP